MSSPTSSHPTEGKRSMVRVSMAVLAGLGVASVGYTQQRRRAAPGNIRGTVLSIERISPRRALQVQMEQVATPSLAVSNPLSNLMGMSQSMQDHEQIPGEAAAAGPLAAALKTTAAETTTPAINASNAAVPPIVEVATGDGVAAATVEDDGASAAPPATMVTTQEPLAGYKDSWDLHETNDIPVFWYVPRAGASTVKQVLQGCHKMTLATESGISEGHDQDAQIAVVKIAVAEEDRRSADDTFHNPWAPLVNVDTTTKEGLARAGRMGFAQSGLAGAMVTPLVHDANGVFDPVHRGRLFAMVREPIDRAVSTFQYLKRTNPEMAMTIEEYAQSPLVENNWMTRYLSNRVEGELDETHLQIAMDVARRKLLVGLRHEFDASIERFEAFFGLRFVFDPTNQEGCRSAVLSSTGGNAEIFPYPDGQAYELLSWQNQYDMELFAYLKTLFFEQEALVHGLPNRLGLISPPSAPVQEQPEEHQEEQDAGTKEDQIGQQVSSQENQGQHEQPASLAIAT